MVERIRLLLETRQLTPTQFADAIGIARPIVSHILSGRNKPSLEVVQRILAAMPDLSMPWLLNGTGAMLTGSATTPLASAAAGAAPPPAVGPGAPAVPLANPSTAPAPPVPETVKNDFNALSKRHFPASPSKAPVRPAKPMPGPRRFAAPAVTPNPAAAAPAPLKAPQALAPDSVAPEPLATAEPVVTAPLGVAPDLATALFGQTEKPIRRIVIFYRDGSFADYQPE